MLISSSIYLVGPSTFDKIYISYSFKRSDYMLNITFMSGTWNFSSQNLVSQHSIMSAAKNLEVYPTDFLKANILI